MNRWNLIKDILLTVTGMILVLSQLPFFTRTPSDLILGAGLTLVLPSVGVHAGTLLRGGAEQSSPPEQEQQSPPSSSPSSPPQEATK